MSNKDVWQNEAIGKLLAAMTPHASKELSAAAYAKGRADALAEVLAAVKAEASDRHPKSEEARVLRVLLTKLRRLGRVVPERKGK